MTGWHDLPTQNVYIGNLHAELVLQRFGLGDDAVNM